MSNLMVNMKRNIILILLIVSVILISGCIQQIKDVERPTEYQTVTIKELISDTTKYNGQEILVRGKFTDMRNRPIPMCEPIGTGLNPEIREGYKTYLSTWGISNQDGEIGVDVIDENAVHISTMPNYKEGQEIELIGIAKSTTVADNCNRDIRYKSVYIEIDAKDIDITLKPLPKTLPENK
jgi:hypothetical protein